MTEIRYKCGLCRHRFIFASMEDAMRGMQEHMDGVHDGRNAKAWSYEVDEDGVPLHNMVYQCPDCAFLVHGSDLDGVTDEMMQHKKTHPETVEPKNNIALGLSIYPKNEMEEQAVYEMVAEAIKTLGLLNVDFSFSRSTLGNDNEETADEKE